jgi:hypothetical protein
MMRSTSAPVDPTARNDISSSASSFKSPRSLTRTIFSISGGSRQAHADDAVETAGPDDSGIAAPHVVGGRDVDYFLPALQAVELLNKSINNFNDIVL